MAGHSGSSKHRQWVSNFRELMIKHNLTLATFLPYRGDNYFSKFISKLLHEKDFEITGFRNKSNSKHRQYLFSPSVWLSPESYPYLNDVEIWWSKRLLNRFTEWPGSFMRSHRFNNWKKKIKDCENHYQPDKQKLYPCIQ